MLRYRLAGLNLGMPVKPGTYSLKNYLIIKYMSSKLLVVTMP